MHPACILDARLHFVFDNSGGSGILVLGVKMLRPDETDATLIMLNNTADETAAAVGSASTVCRRRAKALSEKVENP